MISRRLATDIPGAARMLGISDRVAYDHARVGTLPGCFRLGGKGRWLVSLPALEEFLASGGKLGSTEADKRLVR